MKQINKIPGYTSMTQFAKTHSRSVNTVRAEMLRGYCNWLYAGPFTADKRCNKLLEQLDTTRLYSHSGKELRINRIVSAMRKATNRRRMNWDLTTQQAAELIVQPCSYCGVESGHKQDTTTYNPYNGIDRIDSTKDYTPDNCVPCCRNCNKAKGTLTTTEFKELITRIYHNFNKNQL